MFFIAHVIANPTEVQEMEIGRALDWDLVALRVLSSVSKIFERVLERSKISCPLLPSRSVWISRMQWSLRCKGGLAGVLLLDLSKGFDCQFD